MGAGARGRRGRTRRRWSCRRSAALAMERLQPPRLPGNCPILITPGEFSAPAPYVDRVGCTLPRSHFVLSDSSFLLTFSAQFLFAEVLSSFHVRPRFLRVSAYALLFSFFFVVGFMGPGVFPHVFFYFGFQAVQTRADSAECSLHHPGTMSRITGFYLLNLRSPFSPCQSRVPCAPSFLYFPRASLHCCGLPVSSLRLCFSPG